MDFPHHTMHEPIPNFILGLWFRPRCKLIRTSIRTTLLVNHYVKHITKQKNLDFVICSVQFTMNLLFGLNNMLRLFPNRVLTLADAQLH